MGRHRLQVHALVALAVSTLSVSRAQEPGTVRKVVEVSANRGGLELPLAPYEDRLRHFRNNRINTIGRIGDLDADGREEMAVGTATAGPEGSVLVLFLDEGDAVRRVVDVTGNEGGFGGSLPRTARFGSAVRGIGDWNGDGVPDLAVGAHGWGSSTNRKGSVWILFLNPDGTVGSELELHEGLNGLVGPVPDNSRFGCSLSLLRDLDGDGRRELAVGACGDPTGGKAAGAVWILFLDETGAVRREQKIGPSSGGLVGPVDKGDRFGYAVSAPFAFDAEPQPGLPDLLVGAPEDDEGGVDQGAVWSLWLDASGRVVRERKIAELEGGVPGTSLPVEPGSAFGSALAAAGDVDGDGIVDVAVGAPDDQEGAIGTAPGTGAVWLLYFGDTGEVVAYDKIGKAGGMPELGTRGLGQALGSAAPDGSDRRALLATLPEAGRIFTLELDRGGSVARLRKHSEYLEEFGASISSLRDLDGDGVRELVVGERADRTRIGLGALWRLSVQSEGVRERGRISSLEGGFVPRPGGEAELGQSVVCLGDVDGDGIEDLAAGSLKSGNLYEDASVWILFLDLEGKVRSQTQLRKEDLGPNVGSWSTFGRTIGALGDVDRDGVPDLAIADPFNSIWIAFLRTDGSVRHAVRVDVLLPPYSIHQAAARAIVPLPMPHDGGVQIVVGSPTDPFDGPSLQRLVLDRTGAVVEREPYAYPDNLSGYFGESLAVLGDLDGDGNGELAVGHPYWQEDPLESSPRVGAVWILFLDARGREKRRHRILPGEELTSSPGYITFGSVLGSAGDLDGDGIADLVVGQPYGYWVGAGPANGVLWLLHLNGTRR